MNTQSNNSIEKIYLVSFGNSKKYILKDTLSGEESKLARIETELNSFLKSKFPDEPFAYYTTPRVDVVSKKDVDKYNGYPSLDAEAVDRIKKVLAREVEDMESNARINSDAPYSNVNPAAADIRSIL